MLPKTLVLLAIIVISIIIMTIRTTHHHQAVVVSATGVNSTYFVNRTSTCMASLRAPSAPRPLEFCYWQNAIACCTPANDAAAKETFQAFTDLGPGCAPTDHKIRAAYREVHQFACLPCHPMEPDFRVDKRTGDTHLTGGQISPDPTAKEGEFVWRVCRSFVFGVDESKNGGLWGKNGTKFDACGIRPQGGNSVHGDDTDFTVPSVAYANDNRTQLAQDFVDVLPNFLPGFSAVIVDDSREDFNYNITPCFADAGRLSTHQLVVALFVFVVLMMVFM